MLRAIAVCAVVLLAAGCLNLGGEKSVQDTGCGQCEQETEQLRAQVAQIPQVRSVPRFDYTAGKAPRLFPTLSMDLYVEADSVDEVRQAVVKAVWLSDVEPVDDLLIDMKGPDGKLISMQFSFATERDRKPFLDAWGPRPTG